MSSFLPFKEDGYKQKAAALLSRYIRGFDCTKAPERQEFLELCQHLLERINNLEQQLETLECRVPEQRLVWVDALYAQLDNFRSVIVKFALYLVQTPDDPAELLAESASKIDALEAVIQNLNKRINKEN